MIEVFNIKEGLLMGILSLDTFAELNQLTAKREIESKGKEFLLENLIDKNASIHYDDKGKPYLTNDTRHISLSHSHDKLVLLINDVEATGVDIELIRDKVLKIKHKYLTKNELIDANEDVEKLLIYWAAKESLYKIYGLKEVDFIKNLYVKPFEKEQEGTIFGEINLPNFNHWFMLGYQLHQNYVLVYALNKITKC